MYYELNSRTELPDLLIWEAWKDYQLGKCSSVWAFHCILYDM